MREFTLNAHQHSRSSSYPRWCHDLRSQSHHTTHKLHRSHAQIFEQTMFALFTSASFRLMMSMPHCCPLLTNSESKSSMRITVLTVCWRPDTQSNSSLAFSGTSHTTVAIQAAQTHTHSCSKWRKITFSFVHWSDTFIFTKRNSNWPIKSQNWSSFHYIITHFLCCSSLYYSLLF